MDVIYLHRGLRFVWNAEKAQTNSVKHLVTFEEACEVFFDPLYISVDATEDDEVREAAVGVTTIRRLLVVVHLVVHGNSIRIISARKATTQERRQYEDDI
jgi:uncharacterized DUF497 family protein